MEANFSPPGSKDFQDSFADILNGYMGINPLHATFFKQSADLFNQFCEDISKDMMEYYRNHWNAMKKYAEMNNPAGCHKKDGKDPLQDDHHDGAHCAASTPNGGNKEDTIDSLPASGHDLCGYLAPHHISNFQIQAVMKLDGRLDFDRLKKAVRLSLALVPVFGCRPVEGSPSYWKPLDNTDRMSFCSLEETDLSSEAVASFLQSPLDTENGPMLKAVILRSEENDLLGIKISPVCCDGTGAKEYIRLLADTYSRIGPGEAPSIQNTRKKQDESCKEPDAINPEPEWNPAQSFPETMWPFPWMRKEGNSTRFAVCRFPRGDLDSLSRYGKLRGATVNDLLLTAFYRAMFKISKPLPGVPMDIALTVDLRRYLPNRDSRGIRNLSGGVITSMGRIMNEPFEATLFRVMRQTEGFKEPRPDMNRRTDGEQSQKAALRHFENYYGLMSRIFKALPHRAAYSGDVCFPALSNLGTISGTYICFGKSLVTDAYMVPPVMRAPGLLLFAGSYNGILTLSAGYYKDSLNRSDMENLLKTVRNELMRECVYKKIRNEV